MPIRHSVDAIAFNLELFPPVARSNVPSSNFDLFLAPRDFGNLLLLLISEADRRPTLVPSRSIFPTERRYAKFDISRSVIYRRP